MVLFGSRYETKKSVWGVGYVGVGEPVVVGWQGWGAGIIRLDPAGDI
jgi:hypothetical protein